MSGKCENPCVGHVFSDMKWFWKFKLRKNILILENWKFPSGWTSGKNSGNPKPLPRAWTTWCLLPSPWHLSCLWSRSPWTFLFLPCCTYLLPSGKGHRAATLVAETLLESLWLPVLPWSSEVVLLLSGWLHFISRVACQLAGRASPTLQSQLCLFPLLPDKFWWWLEFH